MKNINCAHGSGDSTVWCVCVCVCVCVYVCWSMREIEREREREKIECFLERLFMSVHIYRQYVCLPPYWCGCVCGCVCVCVCVCVYDKSLTTHTALSLYIVCLFHIIFTFI